MKQVFFKMLPMMVVFLLMLPLGALADNPFAGMKTYGGGQYRVGSDMKAGEYVLIATTDYSGYFAITADTNGKDIIQNGLFEVNSIITVEYGEYVELERCIAVEATDFYGEYTIKGSNPGVMLKVGYDIYPGTYRLKASSSSSGYYCIYNNSRQNKIVENDLFENSAYVTVSGGQYLVLDRCYIAD